jgi:hypothetical protein
MALPLELSGFRLERSAGEVLPKLKEPCQEADKSSEIMIWTFQRGNERISIELATNEDLVMVVTGDGAPRRYSFSESSARKSFQADMEAFLLKTGWTFLECSPERRRGRDRRGFPRLSERRRWWTDSPELWKRLFAGKIPVVG